YSPILGPTTADRGQIGNRPLSWWAVRRVMEYSGRINLWLAVMVGILFAAYTVAGEHWPPYLGRQAFELIKSSAGGIAGLTAGLVLWGLYFAIGFWAFSRGLQANSLGALLTIALPLAAVGLAKSGQTSLMLLTPPGCVYGGLLVGTSGSLVPWLAGLAVCSAA